MYGIPTTKPPSGTQSLSPILGTRLTIHSRSTPNRPNAIGRASVPCTYTTATGWSEGRVSRAILSIDLPRKAHTHTPPFPPSPFPPPALPPSPSYPPAYPPSYAYACGPHLRPRLLTRPASSNHRRAKVPGSEVPFQSATPATSSTVRAPDGKRRMPVFGSVRVFAVAVRRRGFRVGCRGADEEVVVVMGGMGWDGALW